jgi:hypothetical protein
MEQCQLEVTLELRRSVGKDYIPIDPKYGTLIATLEAGEES